MRIAVFIDTSVLCEVLAVPGKCQRQAEVTGQLRERVRSAQTLLLPAAAIIETGNHIAQLTDGTSRREIAKRFMTVLRETAGPEPPWVLHDATWSAELLTTICDGPADAPSLEEMAAQGIGAGDVSILAEAEDYRQRVAHVDLEVWTLDDGLRAYA